MSAEKLLFIIITFFLIVFIFNRYLVLQRISLLLVLTGQFFALIMNTIMSFSNIKPNAFLEFTLTIFGIVIPGVIFFYFYFKNKEGKIKKIYQTILGIFVRKGNPEVGDRIMIEDGSRDTYGLGLKMKIIPEKTSDIIMRGYSCPIEEIPQSVKEGLAETDRLLELKAWRKALEKYNLILKQCGENPVLQFNIGNIYYHLKEYQKAINNYNTVLEMNKITNNLNIFDQEEASHKTAARRIKTVLKKVEDYEIIFNTAVCLVCQGKYEQSIETFKRAGDNKENWINIYQPLALVYEVLGKSLDAAEMYQNLAEIYPEDFEIQKKSGDFCCTMKNYDRAKEYYDRANVLKPDYFQGYLNIGICLSEDKRFQEAVNMLQLVIKISPHIAEVHYNLGNAYYGIGQKPFALSSYKKAIEINPSDYKSLYNLGVILDEMDMKEESVMAFLHSLDIKPDFYEASNNLSVLLCSIGRYDEAVDTYLKALQYNPSNVELYFNLAITLEYQKKFDQAEELYKKIIKMDPKLSDAYYNIGLIRVQKEDLKGAEQYFRKAVDCNLEHHKSYYQLAKLYVIFREYGRCMDCLEKAVQLSSDYIDKVKSEKIFEEIRKMKSYEDIVEAC